MNRSVKVLLLVVGVTVMLTACGAATPSTPAAVPPTTAAPAQPMATAAAPGPATEPATVATAVPPVSEPTVSEPIAAVPNPKLNLNTATGEEFLAGVPNMGNRMVREFLEYRPYVSIQQFRREMGKYISADQIAEYEKYVYVPVAVNDADAATLQQLPGVDATDAADLIAARPYATAEAFLAKLATYVSPAELAAAAGFLSTP